MFNVAGQAERILKERLWVSVNSVSWEVIRRAVIRAEGVVPGNPLAPPEKRLRSG